MRLFKAIYCLSLMNKIYLVCWIFFSILHNFTQTRYNTSTTGVVPRCPLCCGWYCQNLALSATCHMHPHHLQARPLIHAINDGAMSNVYIGYQQIRLGPTTNFLLLPSRLRDIFYRKSVLAPTSKFQ